MDLAQSISMVIQSGYNRRIPTQNYSPPHSSSSFHSKVTDFIHLFHL